LLALALFIISYARPQSGQSQKKVKSEGIELLLLVDVSNSMLAEDIKPSRLELVKKELNRLLELAGGDRIGLVAFAGSAVLQSPVTQDKSALKMYIDSLSTESVSTQGTEFKKALMEAQSAFQRGGVDESEDSVVTRAILIASDGEDNEPGAIELAKKLVDSGIRIFAMGVGTEKGAPIPIRNQYGELKGYRKDKSNREILTKTKGSVLKKLAQVGKGSFYHASFSSNAARNIYHDIENLEKASFDTMEVTNYDEDYQIFLFFGLIFLMIELFLSDKKRKGRIWMGRFEIVQD